MSLLPADGYQARFKGSDGSYFTQPLLFWRDNQDTGTLDGWYLDGKGRLRPASSAGNFVGYQANPENLQLLAARDHWWVVSRNAKGEEAWWSRVLAWLVDRDGYEVKALTKPDSGGYSAPDEVEEDKVQFVFDPTRNQEGEGPWPE